MDPSESSTPISSSSPLLLITSILGAILSILPLDKLISLGAGIGAILAAIFSIRNSYYSTKLSKKELKEDEYEEELKKHHDDNKEVDIK